MNLRALFYISLISITIITTTLVLLGIYFKDQIVASYRADYLEEKSVQLRQVVGGIRNEVLASNFRYIRNQLELMKHEGLFEEFQIQSHSKGIVEPPSSLTTDQYIKLEVPVQFSDEGQEWGKFLFYISKGPLFKIESDLNFFILQSVSLAILCILLFIVSLNFLYFVVLQKLLYNMQDQLEGRTSYLAPQWAYIFEPIVSLSSKITNEVLDSRRKIVLAERQQVYYKIALQVAHDIRSPITSLKTLGHVLPKDLTDAQDLLLKIVNRISGIAEDLLKTAKTSELNQEPPSSQVESPERCSLDICIKDLYLEKLTSLNKISKVRLTYNYEGDSPLQVVGSYEKLIRILSNVVNNALEAIPEEGFISILLFSEERHAVVEVRDNGKGISEADLEILKNSPRSINKPAGNGLGLSSALSYLKSVGGSLEIQSELGRGTLVRVKLHRI